MRESEALRVQARSDLDVATTDLGGTNCAAERRAHVLAKYQQCVEKSVKAAVVALRDAGIVLNLAANTPPTSSKSPKIHKAATLVTAVVLAPKGKRLDALTQMQKAFSDRIRLGVTEIDALVPAWPTTANALHGRNTEYPFEAAAGDWRAPSEEASFTANEVQRAHEVAWPLFHALERIIVALERAP